MSEELLYPAGCRVIRRGSTVPGTSHGENQFQNWNFPSPQILVFFDNGTRAAVPEAYLRELTAEDEARYEEIRRREEEAARVQREKRERIRQKQEETKQYQAQKKAEALEAEKEARKRADEENTARRREEYARVYGLESLRRGSE